MTISREQRCSHCATRNRIPLARLNDNPTCGKCAQHVFPDSPVATTDRSFRGEVEQSAIPVLVDFWAPWCGPCKAMEPSLDALARSGSGRFKVAKVNVEENQALASRFQIRSIPALKLWRDGELLGELTGAVPAQAIEQFLKQHGV